MSKKKDQKRSETKRREREMALIPRKKKCICCGKPMVNTRWCEKCKRDKRLKSKANSRGKSKNTYFLEQNQKEV